MAQKGIWVSGLLFLGKSKEGDIPPLLDRSSETSLMSRTSSGESPWDDLPSFRQKSFHRINILVVNFKLLNTESANFFALERSCRQTHRFSSPNYV